MESHLLSGALRVVLLTGLIFAAVAANAQKTITAREVIDRIKDHVDVPWQEPTVDTFKAGSPDDAVTGIAVTMMSTLDVLQRAAASGKNLIITHEPTFFGHLDRTDDLASENDPVYAAKKAFIDQHHLIIFRFHDYWHRRRPDGINAGMIKAMGWDKYRKDGSDHLFVLPETSLAELANELKKRLGIKALRVVGDPHLKVTKAGFAAGAPGFAAHRKMLQSDDVEVMVMGEGTEWETIEYASDAVAAGKRKALSLLGHIPSEQAGMEECARWLKTFVSEAPIEFIPTREPFWAPK
jgi:putative NIF3 family GTP cyclohydrolase 1 type 2